MENKFLENISGNVNIMERFLRILEVLNSFAEKDDYGLRWYDTSLPRNVWKEINSMKNKLPVIDGKDFTSPDKLVSCLNTILNYMNHDQREMHIFRVLVFLNYSMLIFQELFSNSYDEKAFIVRIANLIYLNTKFNPNKHVYGWIYFILYYAGVY